MLPHGTIHPSICEIHFFSSLFFFLEFSADNGLCKLHITPCEKSNEALYKIHPFHCSLVFTHPRLNINNTFGIIAENAQPHLALVSHSFCTYSCISFPMFSSLQPNQLHGISATCQNLLRWFIFHETPYLAS